MNISKKDKTRFWSKVDKTTECWNWTGGKHKAGYGKIKIKRKTLLSHRVSWFLKKGSIDNNLHVCHKCDNPSCVNPKHLFLGTDLDNINDMLRKGRDSMRGSKNNKAVLKEKDVIEIRSKYSDRRVKLKQIASMYNVSLSAISSVLLNKTWSHL